MEFVIIKVDCIITIPILVMDCDCELVERVVIARAHAGVSPSPISQMTLNRTFLAFLDEADNDSRAVQQHRPPNRNISLE